MALTIEQLPNDLDAVKRMAMEFAAALEDTDKKLKESGAAITLLEARINQLLHWRYGRKAEIFDSKQAWLDFPGLLDDIAKEEEVPSVEADAQTPSAPVKRKGHGRRPIPADLERVRVEHDVPLEQRPCPCCGEERCRIGEDTSEMIEYAPALLFVKQHVRFTYACKGCQGNVIAPPVPDKPIAKGLAGPGLLAHIIVSKYDDHLPLYRLEEIFHRSGVMLPRSTMCGWVEECAKLLTSLYDLMKSEVLKSRVIHTDDTSVPVQTALREKARRERDASLDIEGGSPGGHERRKATTGYIWTYLGDEQHPYIVYDFTMGRAGSGPKDFLGSYKGYLQADALSVYDQLFAPEASDGKPPPRSNMLEVGCWAHARRHIFEAQDTDKRNAVELLARIKELYGVEREAKERRPTFPDTAAWHKHLAEQRDKRARPILTALFDRLEAMRGPPQSGEAPVLPKSPLGKAIEYALSNRVALSRYLDDPILAIDNNASERALRHVVIGRKNWLFAGSERGGTWAAILYSMVESAKRCGTNPFFYLKDVFDRLSQARISQLPDFLPDRWLARQGEEATSAAHNSAALAPAHVAAN